MRKIFCILLATIMLLSGCAHNPSTTPSTNSTGTEDVIHTACLQKVKELAAEKKSLVSAEPLLEYDPEQDIFISVANQECDFFPGYSWWKCTAIVLTKETINPEDIQVDIPIETEYSVEITDLKDTVLIPSFEVTNPHSAFKLYQYMSLQGVDWDTITQMQLEADIALQLKNQCDEHERLAYVKIASDNMKRVNEIFSAAENSFNKLTSADIPKFGAYRVVINFLTEEEPGRYTTTIGSHEETVHNMTFTIAGKQYDVDIGTWRFHKELPQELRDSRDASGNVIGLTRKLIQYSALPGSPYTNGIVNLENNFHFIANEDLTITGSRIVGSQLEILGAQVQIGNKSSYFWDMKRPIEVAANEEVIIDVYVRDERFTKYNVYINTTLILDYQIRNEDYHYGVPNGLFRYDSSIWDTYLMAFCGVDLSSYLAYQGILQADWLDDLPEAWLKE